MKSYMRVKSIHIVNFSGISKLDLNLNSSPGVTLIQGSSGAGKSMVIEAIRWAICGEVFGKMDDINPGEEGYKWDEQEVTVIFNRTLRGDEQMLIVTRKRKKGGKSQLTITDSKGDNHVEEQIVFQKMDGIFGGGGLFSSDTSYKGAVGGIKDSAWWVKDEGMKNSMRRFATEDNYLDYINNTGVKNCLTYLRSFISMEEQDLANTLEFTPAKKAELDTVNNEVTRLDGEVESKKRELGDEKVKLEAWKKSNQDVKAPSNVLALQMLESEQTNLENSIKNNRISPKQMIDALQSVVVQQLINRGWHEDAPSGNEPNVIAGIKAVKLSRIYIGAPKEVKDWHEKVISASGLAIEGTISATDSSTADSFLSKMDQMYEDIAELYVIEQGSGDATLVNELWGMMKLVEFHENALKELQRKLADAIKDRKGLLAASKESKEKEEKLHKISQYEEFVERLDKAVKAVCSRNSATRLQHANDTLSTMKKPWVLRFAKGKELEDDDGNPILRHFRIDSDGRKVHPGGPNCTSNGEYSLCYAALVASELHTHQLQFPLFLDDTIAAADADSIASSTQGFKNWAEKQGLQIWMLTNQNKKEIEDSGGQVVNWIELLCKDQQTKFMRSQEDYKVG